MCSSDLVVIVTSDKDFFQLVDDRIRVFNPRDAGTWYDAAGVVEKFGVPPSQVVDVLALMGDAVDNVKGVPGIGEKGARELVTTWGSLDALLEHAAEVPGKKYREALLNHKAEALHSRQMVLIHTDVPVPFDVEALTYRGPDRAACYELFSDLGFRSLTMDYAPTAESVSTDYALVTDAAGLDALVADIRAAGRMAVRVLADDEAPMRAGIVGLAVSTGARSARYIPTRHAGMHTGPQLTVADALMRALGTGFTIACPGFPENKRTIFKGYLFAGDVLLSESGMKDHPLTPMNDANLVRVMQAQCQGRVGLIDHRAVAQSPAAIRQQMAELQGQGVRIAVVDAVSNDDLLRLGPALAELPLVTAGSGVAIGLPPNFGLKSDPRTSQLPAPAGRQAIVSGSC